MGGYFLTENMTWQQLHSLIIEMRSKLETQKSVTRTISRVNYCTLMNILTNHSVFQYDKNIDLKLNVHGEVIRITLNGG